MYQYTARASSRVVISGTQYHQCLWQGQENPPDGLALSKGILSKIFKKLNIFKIQWYFSLKKHHQNFLDRTYKKKEDCDGSSELYFMGWYWHNTAPSYPPLYDLFQHSLTFYTFLLQICFNWKFNSILETFAFRSISWKSGFRRHQDGFPMLSVNWPRNGKFTFGNVTNRIFRSPEQLINESTQPFTSLLLVRLSSLGVLC